MLTMVTSACKTDDSSATKETQKVLAQQDQYAKGQPVPAFDWSFERPRYPIISP